MVLQKLKRPWFMTILCLSSSIIFKIFASARKKSGARERRMEWVIKSGVSERRVGCEWRSAVREEWSASEGVEWEKSGVSERRVEWVIKSGVSEIRVVCEWRSAVREEWSASEEVEWEKSGVSERRVGCEWRSAVREEWSEWKKSGVRVKECSECERRINTKRDKRVKWDWMMKRAIYIINFSAANAKFRLAKRRALTSRTLLHQKTFWLFCIKNNSDLLRNIIANAKH